MLENYSPFNRFGFVKGKCSEYFLLILLTAFFISIAGLLSWVNSLLVSVVILSGIVHWHQKSRPIPQSVKHYYAISVVFFLYLCFTVFMYEPLVFFENRFEPFRYLVLWWLVFYFFLNWFDDEALLFKALVVSGFFLFVWVVLVLIEQPHRSRGLLEDPIQRGNLAMLLGIMSLVAFFYFKRGWRFLALVAFLSGVVLSILSESRGGWLALIISVITILLVLRRLDDKDFKLGVGLILIFGSIFLLFLEQTPVPSRLERAWLDISTYFSGENLNTSLGARFEMWKVALLAFIEKPVFGWGFDSFNAVYNHYFEAHEAIKPSKASGWGQPHNDYLQFLVETGVIGFGLLMIFLLYPLKVYFNALILGLKQNQRRLVFVALLGIVMLECLLEFMLSDRNFTFRHTLYFFVTVNVMCLMFIARIKNESSEARLEKTDI
ncbi:O-antigen ligase family protein [Thiomicrorhabdus sp. zzn3]|uniref:O-antigen ligase family protein n=1 Tax=Thiomicrorhabdus sp. zzn3 TaxID=3039775 RepID=UPI002436BE05|nr:O-antigen ligase family protein [Thiomicrorhabdus sp. zzn3]MDG6777380.1 O-antigen ligase family protein [Thiomicrorhabdus sp. zzn3]